MVDQDKLASMSDEELQKVIQDLFHELFYDLDPYEAMDLGDEEYEMMSAAFNIPPDPKAFDIMIDGNNNFIKECEDLLEVGELNDYNKEYLDKAIDLNTYLCEWDQRFILSKEEQIKAANKGGREL